MNRNQKSNNHTWCLPKQIILKKKLQRAAWKESSDYEGSSGCRRCFAVCCWYSVSECICCLPAGARARSVESPGACQEKQRACVQLRLRSNSGGFSVPSASQKRIICISSSWRRNHKQMQSVGRKYGAAQRKITFHHPRPTALPTSHQAPYVLLALVKMSMRRSGLIGWQCGGGIC